MKKRLLSLLFYGLIFLGSLSYGEAQESVVAHWNDEEAMRPYYTALSKFREVLEESIVHKNTKEQSIGSGFRAHPSPNPSYDRSPRYLFLEMTDHFSVFYTPLGKVAILNGGPFSLKKNVSQDVLDKMKGRWDLEEVTEKVNCRNFLVDEEGKETQSKSYPFHKESWHGAGDHPQLFLIKSFDGVLLGPEGDQELVIFPNTSLTIANGGQVEKDRALFTKLSGGKGCF